MLTVHKRRQLSKRIQRETRKALRIWRTDWANRLFMQFKNHRHLKNITSEPVHSQACPVEAYAFADLLESVFHSDVPLRKCNLVELMRQVPQFSIREVSNAIGELNNMKSDDDTSPFAEMMKHFSLKLQDALIESLNICFDQGKFNES